MRPQFFSSMLVIAALASSAHADITLDDFFNRASLLKSPAQLAALANDQVQQINAQQSRYTIAGCAVDVIFADDKAQQLQMDVSNTCQPDINVLQQLDNPFDHSSPLTLKKFAEHAGDPIFFSHKKYPNTLFSYVAGSADSKDASDPASANLLAISEMQAAAKKGRHLACDKQSSANYITAFGSLTVKRLVLGWNIQPICHQF